MKKLIVIMVFLSVLTGFACAAGQGEQSKTQEEITFWWHAYAEPSVQDKLGKELADAFFTDSGIKVNVEIISWTETFNKLTLACTGGFAPDCADFYWLHSYCSLSDEFGPIDIHEDVKTRFDLDNYYQWGLDEALYKGRYYGVPLMRADSRIMWYREDLFENAGLSHPPQTWDDILVAAKKLTERDASGNVTRYGMTYGGGSDIIGILRSWWPYLYQAGGQVISDDLTKAGFNTPAGKEALQFLYDAIYKHKVLSPDCISPTYNDIEEYASGRAAMKNIASSTQFRLVRQEADPKIVENTRFSIQPKNKNRDSLGFSGVGVIFAGKNKEASLKWFEFLNQPDIQVKIAKVLELMSPHKTALQDPYFKENDLLRAHSEQFAHARMTDRPVAGWNKITQSPGGPMYTLITDVLTNKNTIDKALAVAENGVNQILKETQ